MINDNSTSEVHPLGRCVDEGLRLMRKSQMDPVGGRTRISTIGFVASGSSKKYRIGDVGPAGGTVFITPSTSGNTTGLYFEVAPFASEVMRTWATGGNQSLSVPGAGGTAIGDGASNTAAIARQAGNVAESSAAVYASEYSLNGFSDWFLPSRDELNELHSKMRSGIGGFSTFTYWSSSEFDDDIAWGQDFIVGDQLNGYKNITLFVRPVRAFP